MWLRSVFLKTLRDCGVPILAWGLGIGAMPPLAFVALLPMLADAEARREILALAQHPAMRLFAEPVDLLTPGGYATWRLTLVLPLLSIWSLLVVSRTFRGEEESGALDVLLATPRSRLRVAMEKLAAIGTALLLIGLLLALMAFAGGKIAGAGLGLDAASLFGLNITLQAGVFGALALVISQFTRERRTAAGITGALLGLSVVMTSAGRTVPEGEWIGRLSPLYYFELNKPLLPNYTANTGGMLVLVALAAVLSGIGVALFVRRDVGGPVEIPINLRVFKRAPRHASLLPTSAWSVWSLRSVFSRSLGSIRASTMSWGLAIAVYAALLTAILRQAQQNLAGLLESMARRGPMYAGLIARFTGGGDIATGSSFLSLIFTFLAVAVAAFAVTLVNRWAADEEEGRLELLLVMPHPRSLVILARFTAETLALLIVASMIFASVALTGAAAGMTLDRGRLAQAAFGMVPVGLVVAALGYLLSGWLRTRAVTGTLIAFVLASFVLTLLGPLFKWPDTVMQLSIFEQYGTPLLVGLRVANTLGLLGVAAAALFIAILRFARKDFAG